MTFFSQYWPHSVGVGQKGQKEVKSVLLINSRDWARKLSASVLSLFDALGSKFEVGENLDPNGGIGRFETQNGKNRF